jgi:uncharacterized protein DUF6167
VGARIFGEEVRAGMAEKENDLRERVGLALHERTMTRETPELAPGSATREGND